MHATTTKPTKHQDQIDLERAAGEGMTASSGEHTEGTPHETTDAPSFNASAVFQRAVTLFKQRPFEVIGVAFGCGLVFGAGAAALMRRR